MEETLFRKKSLERISSPEELGETLHVTNPGVWLLLGAIIVLLAGFLIWSAVVSIDSYIPATAVVENGTLHAHAAAKADVKIEPGMTVAVGQTKCEIASVGTEEDGTVFASAPTTLADGSYDARIIYRTTQILRLLFN